VLRLAAGLPDALVGMHQARVAYAAHASTIGQSRRGEGWLRPVWSRIESRTAPKVYEASVLTRSFGTHAPIGLKPAIRPVSPRSKRLHAGIL
jgi:hypothetical protein